MAGSDRVELAEVLDVFHADFESGEVQKAVEQHRAVACGENEAVAAQPFRIFRVVLHGNAIQIGAEFGASHRQPGMARVRFLDSIH